MITCLTTEDIAFSDKRNKTLLKKMMTAASNGAMEDDLKKVLIEHKSSEAKLPFDVSRILCRLHKKTGDIIKTYKILSKEAALIEIVGGVLTEYIKGTIDGKEKMEDDTICISWKTIKKLSIHEKDQKKKASVKKTKKRKAE